MSGEEPPPPQGPGEDAIPAETLDFLFEYTREAPQRQLAAGDALDAKAFALFSTSAVVVGLAGIGTWARDDLPLGASILLVVAVAAFLIVGLAVLYSMWVRRFRSSFHAHRLWWEFWDEDVAPIKHALVQDIAEAYAANNAILVRKRKALILALLAAVVEIVLVGASLAWSTLD